MAKSTATTKAKAKPPAKKQAGGGFRLFAYEHRGAPLASRSVFYRRLVVNGLTALALVLVSLIAGMIGYHFLGGLEWIDAFRTRR